MIFYPSTPTPDVGLQAPGDSAPSRAATAWQGPDLEFWPPDTKGSVCLGADALRGPVPSSGPSRRCPPALIPMRKRRGERAALKRSACDRDPPPTNTVSTLNPLHPAQQSWGSSHCW